MRKAIFLLFFIFLGSCNYAYAQSGAVDPCKIANERLVKTLDALEKSEKKSADQDAQIAKNKEIVAEQELLAAELKAIVVEYANLDVSDKKARRSFWGKVGKRLAAIVDHATRPETIQAVGTILILAKAAQN